PRAGPRRRVAVERYAGNRAIAATGEHEAGRPTTRDVTIFDRHGGARTAGIRVDDRVAAIRAGAIDRDIAELQRHPRTEREAIGGAYIADRSAARRNRRRAPSRTASGDRVSAERRPRRRSVRDRCQIRYAVELT